MTKHRLDPRRYTGSPDDDLDDDDILEEDKPVIRKYRDAELKGHKPHKTPDRRPKRPEHESD
ncbi:MAG: hypothetical protein OQK99_00850 [Gammaproteobacteria bacterium]|jgi:hypothetical protein|nr:hypothetical protein [Gammaproteobacteria bacterium]